MLTGDLRLTVQPVEAFMLDPNCVAAVGDGICALGGLPIEYCAADLRRESGRRLVDWILPRRLASGIVLANYTLDLPGGSEHFSQASDVVWRLGTATLSELTREIEKALIGRAGSWTYTADVTSQTGPVMVQGSVTTTLPTSPPPGNATISAAPRTRGALLVLPTVSALAILVAL